MGTVPSQRFQLEAFPCLMELRAELLCWVDLERKGMYDSVFKESCPRTICPRAKEAYPTKT